MQKSDRYEKIIELSKRRGFFWPSYEIYGGASGFLTYGPLGSIFKQRIEKKFREFFVKPLGIIEMESSIVMPAKVLEASGHVEAFRELMVECANCRRKFRADHLLREQAGISDTQAEKLNSRELAAELRKHNVKCPECSKALGKPKHFMTMFETTIGPYSNALGYGRPEAAQGIFVEFKRLFETARDRLPLGVIQIGHALRNEISPRQGPIRLREFTIADIEFFFDPEEPHCPHLRDVHDECLRLIPAEEKQKGNEKTIDISPNEALEQGYIETEWQAYFMTLSKIFMNELGVPDEKQRFSEKLQWERAHYSTQGYDQEVHLERWGWTEVSGHNYRTDYDLKQHSNHSNVDMRVFREYEKPIITEEYVVEPILPKIGPEFKGEASKVVTLLAEVDPQDVYTSLEKDSHFMLKSFRITPEHVKISRKTVEKTGRRFLPHVVEPSFGVDRLVYIVLEFAYFKKKNRVILKLPRELAPVQVGIYPLVRKDGLTEKADAIRRTLLRAGFTVEYDEKGAIGRRYARADEAGIPLCITVDYQTLEENSVTIRNRNSWEQARLKIENIESALLAYLNKTRSFDEIDQNPR